MTEQVTIRREYGQWNRGTIQVGDEPEKTWRADTCEDAIKYIHSLLGQRGINLNSPGNVAWHHIVGKQGEVDGSDER